MSLQRVFESARKLGIPVIVTDPAGRDPMVVLPLEHFEAMAGSAVEETTRQDQNDKPLVKSDVLPNQAMPAWESPEKMPEKLENMSEMAPEERFYLEPVEDGTN
ncbi:MAG: hypothetical protein WC641_02260 [Patescibacteria group bacterium]